MARFLHLENRNGYFLGIMVIYYSQNFGKGDEHGISKGYKTVEPTYTINDSRDVMNKKRYIIENFIYRDCSKLFC